MKRRLLLLLTLLAAGTLWLGRSLLASPVSPPQLILVLGGDVKREKAAGRLAAQYSLPVVVSGGSNPEYARWLLDQEGLRQQQYRLDYRAHDTLTNFTTVVDDLRRGGIRHVLLVTSSDHMDRALLVGRVVAGSRGIQLTPVAVPCGQHCFPESLPKRWGDGLRAVVWVLSGRDLKNWAQARLAQGRD